MNLTASFMIPAMKQPEFQIVSKKVKISRAQNWCTDGNTAKVMISHSIKSPKIKITQEFRNHSIAFSLTIR